MKEKIIEFKKKYPDIKTPILQEIMFFHRVKDEDTICLSLEFLNVLEAEYSGNLRGEKASYKKSIQIRQILYNLPALDIIHNESLTSKNKMEKILNILEKKGVDVSHLENIDFEDFFIIVEIFKNSSFYLDTNKRWSS